MAPQHEPDTYEAHFARNESRHLLATAFYNFVLALMSAVIARTILMGDGFKTHTLASRLEVIALLCGLPQWFAWRTVYNIGQSVRWYRRANSLKATRLDT